MGECSFWQFLAAVEGWKAANSPEEAPKAPTPEEHDAIVARFS